MLQKMKTTVKVRNHHIDGYGHVNNAQYLTYLEVARSDFFEEMGFSLKALADRGIQVFLTDLTASFRYPAILGDILDIYGWFIDIRRRKATWGHEIYIQQTNKLIFTGTATGVFLNNGKITTIPRDIVNKMSLYCTD